MKDTITIMIILVIIFSGGLYIKRYLQESSDKIINELGEIKEEIEKTEIDNSHNQLKETADKIYKEWEKTNKKWSIIILHSELDLIEMSLISMKSNIETKDYENAIEKIDKSIFLLEHIIEKEKFNIKNIF